MRKSARLCCDHCAQVSKANQKSIVDVICVGVRNQAPCQFTQSERAETPLIVQRLATEGLRYPAASH